MEQDLTALEWVEAAAVIEVEAQPAVLGAALVLTQLGAGPLSVDGARL